jgi:fluoride exporter
MLALHFSPAWAALLSGLRLAADRPLYGAIAIGAAFGALARHGCSLAAIAAFGSDFPWGTLVANGAGSFLIGMIAALAFSHRLVTSTRARMLLIPGFCGGFTTFSIFSLETLLLAGHGAWMAAAFNLLLSIIVWLAAVWLGWRAGAALSGAG